MALLTVGGVFLCISLVLAHQSFRYQIPNGFNVKHPCNPRQTWPAVGHMNVGHTNQKNLFGQAWLASGFNWTTVCPLDSDQDGLTNGEELGDPNCVWVFDTQPSGPVLGHPGFCDQGRDYCGEEMASFQDCPRQIRKPPVKGRGPPGGSAPPPFIPRAKSEPHPQSSGSPKLRAGGSRPAPSITRPTGNPWGPEMGGVPGGMGQPGFPMGNPIPGGMVGGSMGGMQDGMMGMIPGGMSPGGMPGMSSGGFPGQPAGFGHLGQGGGMPSGAGMMGLGGAGAGMMGVGGAGGGGAGAVGSAEMLQRIQRQQMEAERIRQAIRQFNANNNNPWMQQPTAGFPSQPTAGFPSQPRAGGFPSQTAGGFHSHGRAGPFWFRR